MSAAIGIDIKLHDPVSRGDLEALAVSMKTLYERAAKSWGQAEVRQSMKFVGDIFSVELRRV